MQRFSSISLCLALGSLFISNAVLAQASSSLIVKWKPQTSISLRSSFSSQVKQYQELSATPQTAVIEVETHSLENIKQQLQNDPHVEYVEENASIHSHTQPNDPRYIDQWALESNDISIGVEQAWTMITDSSSIKVAVIDSGCSYEHDDMKNNVWRNTSEIPDNGIDDDRNGYVDDIVGYDFQNNDTDPSDDFEHGSMVFGILGAQGNNGIGISGISWNAQIMCLKVLDAEGNSSISKAIDAIDYAIQKDVRIINLSWGYIPSSSPSRALEEAIVRSRDAGILVVASAGNGAQSGGQNNDLNVNRANYPASYIMDNIISVAATDVSDQLADFSYYGAQSVDLGAPGVSILSTHPVNYYHYFTGTSASAPHVTGAASLLWAFNPALHYGEIKRLILETTDANESLNGKTLTSGRLNIARAIESSPSAGGTLLERPSLFPNTSPQSSSGNGSGDETVSAQGGCSLSKNQRRSSPLYLFLIFTGISWMIFRRSLKAK